MDVSIFPRDREPFKIFADAPYDCTILIFDRESGTSAINIHTHKAGLLMLKEAVDKALNSTSLCVDNSRSEQ